MKDTKKLQKVIKYWGGNGKNGIVNLKLWLVEVSGAPQKYADEKKLRLAKQQPTLKNYK